MDEKSGMRPIRRGHGDAPQSAWSSNQSNRRTLVLHPSDFWFLVFRKNLLLEPFFGELRILTFSDASDFWISQQLGGVRSRIGAFTPSSRSTDRRRRHAALLSAPGARVWRRGGKRVPANARGGQEPKCRRIRRARATIRWCWRTTAGRAITARDRECPPGAEYRDSAQNGMACPFFHSKD